MPKKLARAARVAVNECLGVREGETALIVTNPEKDVSAISMAVYGAILEAGGVPTLIYQQKKTQLDFAESAVLKAIASNPDIVISLSKEKLGKDKEHLAQPILDKYDHVFNYLLGEKKMRSFWSPSVTVEMFAKTVPIDYTWMRKCCTAVKAKIDEATEVRVTAPGGTDVMIGVKGREARSDDGNFSKPGTGGNLPCGEVFVSPELGTASGTIVFDGCLSTAKGESVVPHKPVTVLARGGFITEVVGNHEDAQRLSDDIESGKSKPFEMAKEGKLTKAQAEEYAKNAAHIGELGIGLNPATKIVGNMLEDEKVYKTCHFAIGSNYDDDANALIHLDCLVWYPTITVVYADGREEVIMKDGIVEPIL
ncbi:MAG: peptidase M17 [Thermoplasmata archaeon HGW-Thermoplasmata-1]|nr:MAG: peptidase M17 [Thermoplasmata archaeon HGW-Thermoplasmata-1]